MLSAATVTFHKQSCTYLVEILPITPTAQFCAITIANRTTLGILLLGTVNGTQYFSPVPGWISHFCCVVDCFYIGLFDCSWIDSLYSHVILQKWPSFYSMFLNIHQSGVFTAPTWLVSCETTAFSVCSVYTIQPCHFMQSHIRKAYATCTFGIMTRIFYVLL